MKGDNIRLSVLKFIISLGIVLILFYGKSELHVNASNLNGELVYKSNGNYYTVNTLGNTAYVDISRNADFYLKIDMDGELMQGSIINTYVEYSPGSYATNIFKCLKENSNYYRGEDFYTWYIPISSALKYQQGSRRLYYDMTLANGQIIKTSDKGTTNAFYVNLLGEYTVSYNANGGIGAPSSQTKYKESNLILSSTVPTRTGYIFKGWSTSSTATSATYQPGESYTLNSNTTLYAIWKKKEDSGTSSGELQPLIPSYYVTYDANGGQEEPEKQSFVYNKFTYVVGGKNVNVIISNIIPYKMGYRFLGWSTDSESKTPEYMSGDEAYFRGNVTLYAVWKKNNDKTNSTNNSTIKNISADRKRTTIIAKSRIIEKGTKPFYLRVKTNGDGAITYKSSNSKIVTISSTGEVTVKDYGTVTITIQVAETSNYFDATKKITIKVVPKKVNLKKVSSIGKKRLSVSWKKDKTVSGYQVQFCTRKDFKQGTYQRMFSKSKTKMGIYGLKSGKVFYVRIRGFKKVRKKKYYGAWSKVKKVKIK